LLAAARPARFQAPELLAAFDTILPPARGLRTGVHTNSPAIRKR
jgi:hypothetical protein